MLDRTRLAKLLALTTSDNDAEALSAMRKANEIVKGETLTWDDLLMPTQVTNITLQRRPMQPAEAWTGGLEAWAVKNAIKRKL